MTLKFAYMVAAPEVTEPKVTAWRGELAPAFAAVAGAGFAGVELMINDPLLYDAGELTALAAEYGLALPIVCTGEMYAQSGLSLGDPDPAVRANAVARLRATAALADGLGAHVNVGRLRGRYAPGIPPEQTLAWIGEGLAAGAAVSPRVRILLEPISRYVANCLLTTAEGLAFVNGLGVSNVNLMLDTMHMEAEGENVASSLAAAVEQCYHVHIGQADRLPLGTGDYDIGPVLNALRQLDYQHWVGVEVWQEPDQETALRLSAQTLQKWILQQQE